MDVQIRQLSATRKTVKQLRRVFVGDVFASVGEVTKAQCIGTVDGNSLEPGATSEYALIQLPNECVLVRVTGQDVSRVLWGNCPRIVLI